MARGCVQARVEGTFLDRPSQPVPTPAPHRLLYTKSSPQGAVAAPFVPFWGGEGGWDEASHSGFNSFLCCGFFLPLHQCMTSCELGSLQSRGDNTRKLTWVYGVFLPLSLFFSNLFGTF